MLDETGIECKSKSGKGRDRETVERRLTTLAKTCALFICSSVSVCLEKDVTDPTNTSEEWSALAKRRRLQLQNWSSYRTPREATAIFV